MLVERVSICTMVITELHGRFGSSRLAVPFKEYIILCTRSFYKLIMIRQRVGLARSVDTMSQNVQNSHT